MADALTIELAGETVELLAGRALYWPARARLLIADLHLGKEDSFRRAGIAVPLGSTSADLARLAGLLARCRARALWILGDMLHGPLVDTSWRGAWQAFQAAHPELEVVLVRGNHDRSIAAADLAIRIVTDPVADDPFLLCHDAPDDRTAADGRVAIGGHVHPVVRVPGFHGRFPAFVQTGHRLLLPAFSAFTGGWLVTGATGRSASGRADSPVQAYACMETELLALNVGRSRSPGGSSSAGSSSSADGSRQ